MSDFNSYFDHTTSGTRLTKAFYELSLEAKWGVIQRLLDRGSLQLGAPENTKSLYNRAILAVLQHSTHDLKKEYPVVHERDANRACKDADTMEFLYKLPAVTIP